MYCLCVWGGTAKSQLLKAKKIINFAARIVTGLKKNEHITQALDSVGFPNIETLVAQRDAIKVFKALRDECAPRELRAMLTPRFAVCNHKTRSSDRLHLQKCRLTASQKAGAHPEGGTLGTCPSVSFGGALVGAEGAPENVIQGAEGALDAIFTTR